MYRIFDRQTSQFVGKPYVTRRKAQHRADALDLQYGAVRYSVQEERRGSDCGLTRKDANDARAQLGLAEHDDITPDFLAVLDESGFWDPIGY
jgi:hypothetical protein